MQPSSIDPPTTPVPVVGRFTLDDLDAGLRRLGVTDGRAGLPRKLALIMEEPEVPAQLAALVPILASPELRAHVVVTISVPELPMPLTFALVAGPT